jgi:hypothetical protein
MKLKNLICFTIVLTCFASAANAGRVSGNSDYGGNFSSSPKACTTTSTISYTSPSSSAFSFSCITDGATITAEAFIASTNSSLEMFDFEVTNAPSNYTLTLTSTGSPINSATDLGLFTCSPGGVDPPQCSNQLPSGVTTLSNYGSLVSNFVASFPVTGATSANTFVFFVALNDPNGSAASVSATLAPTVSATAPEPSAFTMLGAGLFAFAILRRRIVSTIR